MAHAPGRGTARWRVQVRRHGEVVHNCEAQGNVGAHQHHHVLSSPHVIAVDASLQSVVGPWWALKGEGVSISEKGGRVCRTHRIHACVAVFARVRLCFF